MLQQLLAVLLQLLLELVEGGAAVAGVALARRTLNKGVILYVQEVLSILKLQGLSTNFE